MPIPNIKFMQIDKSQDLITPGSVMVDDSLDSVRAGITAMLALVENDRTVAKKTEIRFRMVPDLREEEYRIACADDGILVEAGDAPAAVYAAATIAQMQNEHGGRLPLCKIEDTPRFGWRGLMIDVCRHFFSLDTIKRLVDLMAYYKLNRLHLHLSDDQGFRFESERFPLLNKVGSFRDSTAVRRGAGEEQDNIPHGGYYKKEELRELVRFAKERGIEIVPELDMPGHAVAMIASYPELACFSDAEHPVRVATSFGIKDFSKKLLCAGNEKTFTFLFALLDEIMDVFPFDYIHLGGDEAVKDEWKRCTKCQAVMREQGLPDERELQGWFLNQASRYLKAHGKTAIVWNDGLCQTLDDDIVCQHWTPFFIESKNRTVRHANAGGRVIASAFLRVYFDYPYAMTPLRKTYAYEPIPCGIARSGSTRRKNCLFRRCRALPQHPKRCGVTINRAIGDFYDDWSRTNAFTNGSA
jgi:hexosaminidase